MKKRRFLPCRVVALVLAAAVLQALCPFSYAPKAYAGDGLHGWVRRTFPKAAEQVRSQYGLKAFESQGTPAKESRPAVILIHGLDEPGRVWMNLAPVLNQKGFAVWLMSYPNDQSIETSARFFFSTLCSQRFDTGEPVALVAHSMGGLVARQMLTDPDIGYMQGAAEKRGPKVSHLIMIGTPNHGSQLARFRILMEVREQVLNQIHGQGPWLQGFLDGSGEAGGQLLPGSGFLTRLNGRPHPRGVRMAVIAGRLSSWLPAGDGLVSFASAKLDSLPFFTVPGNHLSMIRNLSSRSRRVPPAIPVVLGLLSRQYQKINCSLPENHLVKKSLIW